MQQILNVITPATSYDFVTLDEMKTMLLIPPTDTSKDELLTVLITDLSETIAKMCNRVFGYEAVDETFYQLNDAWVPMTRRLYLSRWPVVLADITSINTTVDGSGILTDLLPSANLTWFLEEATGTLYLRPDCGGWYDTVDVMYSGGYELPDDCPGPLKFVMQAILKEAYAAWSRDPSLFGVRQMSHKESRIGYYGPNMMSAIGLPDTWKAAQSIMNKYIRHWA